MTPDDPGRLPASDDATAPELTIPEPPRRAGHPRSRWPGTGARGPRSARNSRRPGRPADEVPADSPDPDVAEAPDVPRSPTRRGSRHRRGSRQVEVPDVVRFPTSPRSWPPDVVAIPTLPRVPAAETAARRAAASRAARRRRPPSTDPTPADPDARRRSHRRADASGRADATGDTRAAPRRDADGQPGRSATVRTAVEGRPSGWSRRPPGWSGWTPGGRPSPVPSAPQPTVVVEPIVDSVDPHLWGRIDEDGVVYVTTSAGERADRQLAGGRHRGRAGTLRSPVRRLLHRDRTAGGASGLRHR